MTKAIRILRTGGPEVLSWEDVSVPDPGPGQVRVRHSAVGLNYIDTYHRSGLYPVTLPSGLGLEAAGVIEAVGEGVTGFTVGDRVCYGTGPIGAYAEARVMPTATLLRTPAGIDDRTAAAVMLQGMTAEYLLRRTFKVERGMTILVHAAAGGVGLLLCQWASHLGAIVIGTVGSDAKAALAKAHGCAHPIVYSRDSFVDSVKDITAGQGVAVVYDGVGKDTFAGSLDCLAPRGMMVPFGNASGPVPPVDPLVLTQKGSLFLTRPSLMHYTAKRNELEDSAAAVFDVIASGAVKVRVDHTYPLSDAAQAHRDLEGRKTTGSVVLIP
ncbi:MAG: quinone oxidoreductase family protein [Alphaproteobacteria bacterium]